jgi:4-diphosphocytidyl-2-C-methyl-D-erythritol kinase
VSSAASVAAQAKINLVLRVLGRRDDGYHALETVFQRVDLADEVRVRVVPGASIDMRGADVGPAERNLAFRAALAYREAAGWPSGFAIEIEKRIPVGGGLGGGSADAGAVLRALDFLAPAPLGHGLQDIAANLGSDVPFLAATTPTAIAHGRGERLTPVPALPPRPVALAVPGFPVSTADAYGWLAHARAASSARSPSLSPAELGTWERIEALAENDLQAAVEQRHPRLEQLRLGLGQAGARIAMLSGSGSTVLGVFENAPSADTLERAVGCRVILSRTSRRVVPVERDG